MIIAIVSDLHLGYERFEEDAFKQASEALWEASKTADLILIPGDIFDKRYPKPDVISQAINIFRELSKQHWGSEISDYKGKDKIHTKVPIIAIPGTHERIAEGKENAVRLLSLAGLLADTSEATITVQKGSESVSIFGLGGLSEEMVKEKIKTLQPSPTANSFNIFMFHQSIHEMLPFSDHFMRYVDLPKGFDLYVCGHMHSRQEALVNGKKLLIPGSTVLTQLKGEEQAKKGFILFDTKDSSHKFIEINSRPYVFRNIEIKEGKPTELLERCENEIASVIKSMKEKPIVRIKVSGTLSKGFNNADLQIHSLSARFSGKAFLSFDTSQLASPNAEAMAEGLREGKIDDMPVKELGILTLSNKLKELSADNSLDYIELFNVLAGPNKEKALKAANEILFPQSA